MRRPARKSKSDISPKQEQTLWVASALPGVEALLRSELEACCRTQIRFGASPRSDEFHFTTSGNTRRLGDLRLCQAIHLKKVFAVSRPRTLLSPEHLASIVGLVRQAKKMAAGDEFTGFRFDAAGSSSPTFGRLASQLQDALGMQYSQADGDCVITVRPTSKGWEVLCRVGNRPLGTRRWRVVDYHGSLNATLAAAMVELAHPRPRDVFLNVMCGSGTLLIERLARCRVAAAIGIDRADRALDAAVRNTGAAGFSRDISLVRGDAQRLPLPEASVDTVCCDLPWGETHGSRDTNAKLYGQVFTEAHRVCRPGARMVVLTQDTQALKSIMAQTRRHWHLEDERTFVQRGFRPVCQVFRKTD